MNVRAVIAAFVLAGIALTVTVWVGGGLKEESEGKKAPQGLDTTSSLPPDTEAPFPKAVMDETSHDFGDMELGDTGRHTFIIRNEGEDVLKLAKGKSTCKCTLSELAQDEIPPGGTAEIHLEWEPKAASTSFGQQAQIHTNDPENKLINLEINGKVYDAITIEPAGSLNVGNIQEGVGADTQMLVFSQILGELDAPKVDYKGERLTFEVTPIDNAELTEHNAKVGYAIKIHTNPDVPVGSFAEKFDLIYNLKGEEVRTQKTVEGQRRGPIRLMNTPGTTFYEEIALVDFGYFDAKEGKKQAIILIIENPESGPVSITDAVSELAVLKVTHEPHKGLELKNRSAFRVTLELPPGSPPVDVARKTAPEILLKTDHPDVPEIVLHAEIHSR